MRYPGTVNLPFNGDIIKDSFIPLAPGAMEPAGAGHWVIFQGNSLVMERKEGRSCLPEGELPAWSAGAEAPLCFGLWQGTPLRIVSLAMDLQLPASYIAEPLTAVSERIDDQIITLGGIARQILYWEQQSKFCSCCGSGMDRISGGWGKRCTGCGHEHFPHIHPCAIVLVRRGEEFLLVHKPEWAAGRYSLVAGFLDFGESLEECARREVLEETGIEIGAVQYVGSQCWPFPSQLMAGFVADYAKGEIVVDRNELEDASWFCVEDMPESLPSLRSIARWIIDTFALGKSLSGK